VTNQESILDSENADEIRKGIANSLRGFRIDLVDSQRVFKRKFLEMASMDGAIIFGDNRIRGFGSMIKTTDNLSATGARTTAALSALQHGAFPVKISSDGQISMYDKSSNSKIEFM
jgi:DNA integrity scanning protein DisA with diadenylate cyclase activity